jgi:N-acetylmuramoyl-L-alanine amidase
LVAGACAAVVIAVVAAAVGSARGPSAPRASRSTRARSTTTSSSTSTTRPRVTATKPTTPRTAPPTTAVRPRSTAAPATVPPTLPPTVPPGSGSGSLRAVAGKTIVIDAGHDGGNSSHASEISRPIFIGTGTRACDTVGTETNDGYPEHAYTFDVALRVQALLQQAGAHVVMTRTTDTGVGPCIDERAYIGNRAHAAVGISIHADGGPATGRGFCVYMPALTPGYTDDIYSASHRLGVDIRDEYGATTGIPPATYACSNGLAEANNYGGLNLSNVPKVLFETANMRSAADAAVIEQSAARQRIALGIALGLARYLAG